MRAVTVRAPGADERSSTRTGPPRRGAIGPSSGLSTSRPEPAAGSDSSAKISSCPAIWA